MKRKIRKTKLSTFCLVAVLTVLVTFSTVLAIDLLSDTSTEDYYIVKHMDVSPYRADLTAGSYKIPECPDGYIFAGWFTEKSCELEEALPKTTTTGSAYAKFVPADILGLKVQVSSNLANEVITDDETGNIRFVTSVDSLNYSKVGFKIQRGTGSLEDRASSEVYESLYATIGDASDGYLEEYFPEKEFNESSEYFKVWYYKNVPETAYVMDIQVTPYWLTLDGTEVTGETSIKTVNKQRSWEYVIVDDTANDDGVQMGTLTHPYTNLETALDELKAVITYQQEAGADVDLASNVYVKKNLSVTASEWEKHGLTLTIAGNPSNNNAGTLDFSTLSDLYIHDSVTFKNIALQFPAGGSNRVFAEGNNLVIESSATVTNTVQLFGGSVSENVKSTNIEVYAGTYSAIYGASAKYDVLGDTKVTVGVGVNPSGDYTDHASTNLLFGAGYKGTVYGNTNITVESGAIFNYIYGGGDQAEAIVKGSTNVNFAGGNAYGIYGGSKYGVNADTYVAINGGKVYDVMGGCHWTSMTGNTNIEVFGGEIIRRIYAGCYNDVTSTGYHVTGHTNVLVGPKANITFNYLLDANLCAVSRYGAYTDERGSFIFNENSEYINETGGYQTSPVYHYRVITNGNNTGDLYGNVFSAGECLYIVPKEGYVATVTLTSATGEVLHYTQGESYYPLQSVSKSEQIDIYVTFNTTEATTFIANAEAKIATGTGYAYYETLEQAIAAAEKMENATIENLSSTKEFASITIAESKNGTVTTDKKNCLVGETVTLTVTPDEGYNLTGLSVTKDGTAVDVGTIAFAGGTYSFIAEKASYTVEATFKPIIWKATNAEWDVTGQYDGVISVPSGDGDSGWLDSYSTEYGDFDLKLTLRDQDNASDNYRAAVRLMFTNGEYATFTVTNDRSNDDATTVYDLQSMGDSILYWKYLGYTLTDAQVAKLTGQDGVEFRIVRVDETVDIYIDGTHAYEGNISELTEGAADLTTQIILRVYGNTGIATDIPYSIGAAPEQGTIAINDTENGTVIANTTKYCVGDEVTLTVTPDTNYDCTSLMVDGVEAELSDGMSGTYTFTATKATHEVEATFTRKIFGNSADWDVTSQYDGYLTIPSSDGDSGWVETNDKDYGDVDVKLILRDQDMEADNYRAAVRLYFQNDQYVSFTITNDLSNDDDPSVYNLQTMGGTILNWKNLATLTDEQVEKLTGEDGMEFRVVRIGDAFAVYLDGTCMYTYDNSTGTTVADQGTSIVLRFYGNTGKDVKVPFTIDGAPETVTVDIAATENGTITSNNNKTEYIVGEKVVLTVAGNNCNDTDYTNDYYYSSLKVNDEEVTVDSDGNYTFTATETKYDVTGSFKKSIFQSNESASFDIMNQHKGVVYQKSEVSGTSPWLYTVETYMNSDASIIVKAGEDDFDADGNCIDSNGDRTAIRYYGTTSGKNYGYSILLQNGKYYVGHSGSVNGYDNALHTFSAEETKKIKEEGIELRLVKIGSEVHVYLDGNFIATETLTQIGENEGTKLVVQRFDDGGVRVPIEYKLSEEIPETVVLDIAENEGGTITTDCKNYLIGEKVTITVTANNGYEFKSLKVAGEEVTVVDGTYTFTATEESYKVEASYKQISTITIAETTNGTVTAGSDKYYVGDEVTLTVTPDTNYDCTSLLVDGVEVTLSDGMSGTYTFTATKATHEVEATFTRKIFGNSADWDVTSQYDGYLTIPSSDGDSGWVETNDKDYGDVDVKLILRDQDMEADNYRAAVRLYFQNDQYVSFTITNDLSNDDDPSVYNLQTMGGTILNWKNLATLTDEQVEKLTGEDGMEFRLVRIGDALAVYLDGTCVYTYNISTANDSVAEVETSILFRFYGNSGKDVKVPFSIGGTPEKVTVNLPESVTNGEITKDKEDYIIGENITLTVAGDGCDDSDTTNDYYYDSLKVISGDTTIDATVDSNGKYTFKATETTYDVEVSFKKSFFQPDASWDIMNQHKGIVYQKADVTGSSGWLKTVEKYANSDTSIIIKAGSDDFDEDGNWIDNGVDRSDLAGDRTAICFSGSTAYGYGINLHTDGKYYIGNSASGNGHDQSIHEFTDEETEKIKEEGIELRVIRIGTEAHIYLDGKFIATDELPYEADEKTIIYIKRFDDGGIRVPIEYKFTEDDPTPVTLNCETVENGTFSGLKDYIVGEQVTIKAEGADGYACNYITVGGEEVELEADGTYTFKATKESYEITGTFVASQFATNTNWNVQGQFYGNLLIPANTNDNTGWLNVSGNYSEICTIAQDLTSTANDYAMVMKLEFSNGAWVGIRLTDVDENGVWRLQSMNDTPFKWACHYTLTDEESEKVTGEGLEFKMVRNGTILELYLGGNLVKELDLTSNSSGITDSMEVTGAGFRVYGNNDGKVETVVPYTLVEATPVTVSISDADEGIVIADNVVYYLGSTITLTGRSKEGYA